MTKRNLLLVSAVLLSSLLLAAFQPAGAPQKTWAVPGQNATRPSIPTLTPTPTNTMEPADGPGGEDGEDNETASPPTGTPFPTFTPSREATSSSPEEQAPSAAPSETPQAEPAITSSPPPPPTRETLSGTATEIPTSAPPSPTPTATPPSTPMAPRTLGPLLDLLAAGGGLTLLLLGFILLHRSSEPEQEAPD